MAEREHGVSLSLCHRCPPFPSPFFLMKGKHYRFEERGSCVGGEGCSSAEEKGQLKAMEEGRVNPILGDLCLQIDRSTAGKRDISSQAEHLWTASSHTVIKT